MPTAASKETEKIIREHVVWSMAAGFVPIPFVDIAAVTAVQMDMLTKLATERGVKFAILDAKSWLTALVGGGAARLGANLLKFVPGVGTALGGVSMSLMSGASTYAVGQVALNEFSSGRKLGSFDVDAARGLYEDAFERGKKYVADVKAESNGSGDIFTTLERLAELQEKGLLTEEEFLEQKEKLLERL